MGKVKSIMPFPMDECIVCGNPHIQIHHVMFGTANRKPSDHYGLIVPLCQEHHTGRSGVHFVKDFDMTLKKMAQERFDAVYGANITFFEVFNISYL